MQNNLHKNKSLFFFSILTGIIWWVMLSIALMFLVVIVAFVLDKIDLEMFTALTGIDSSHPADIANVSSLSLVTISLLLFLRKFVLIILVVFIIENFRKLFTQLKKEKVFQEKNVRLLEKIAYFSIVVTIVSINFSMLLLAFAFMLLVFAAIFRYGIELQTENDLTV